MSVRIRSSYVYYRRFTIIYYFALARATILMAYYLHRRFRSELRVIIIIIIIIIIRIDEFTACT